MAGRFAIFPCLPFMVGGLSRVVVGNGDGESRHLMAHRFETFKAFRGKTPKVKLSSF